MKSKEPRRFGIGGGELLLTLAAMNVRRYLAGLSTGRLILWCYLIWYLVVLVRYFDASLRLWLTSLGLSIIIGIMPQLARRTRIRWPAAAVLPQSRFAVADHG